MAQADSSKVLLVAEVEAVEVQTSLSREAQFVIG